MVIRYEQFSRKEQRKQAVRRNIPVQKIAVGNDSPVKHVQSVKARSSTNHSANEDILVPNDSAGNDTPFKQISR
jgi:hypothetical protein